MKVKRLLSLILCMAILLSIGIFQVSAEDVDTQTYLLGDADGDGEVSVLDATRIQRYLASLIDETQIDIDAADVDSNGIDIIDATQIQRWLAGFAVQYAISETLERTIKDTLPSDVSNITSVADVPLIELNNGVMMPQLGLGTQIQRLESDRSESGRKLLNDTSHDAVVAALQSGYRHLDTAHGYYNERGVGQGIIDSGVPREEIWLTSKLWPSEYGEGTTMAAIDSMLERLQVDYIDLIYLHHPAGDYVGAWKDLEKAYKQGKVRALGISNFDNWPEAFYAIVDDMEIKPQILQIECHPFAQRLETRELAARYNIQIECWYPLGHADDRLLNNTVLSAIAQAHNKSVVQIILRWHMQEGFSAVPGSTNPDHIKENIEIFDFELSDEEMAQIRAMDRGEAGRYFNINYQWMGNFFLTLNE